MIWRYLTLFYALHGMQGEASTLLKRGVGPELQRSTGDNSEPIHWDNSFRNQDETPVQENFRPCPQIIRPRSAIVVMKYAA